MSASSDRPPSRMGRSAFAARPLTESYDDVVTGAPGTVSEPPYAEGTSDPPFEPRTGSAPAPSGPRPTRSTTRRELPGQTRAARREQTHAPIVPAGSVTSRSLTLVISIMCFLACLTAGAVYMMNQSAQAWLKDIASEVTVQVEPREGAAVDEIVKNVAAFLGKQAGVRDVKPLAIENSRELLEPWLGQSDIMKTLPVPRLVAVEIDRVAPPNLDELRVALARDFDGVTLDDHRRWQQQIRTVTRSFALGGLAILLLVAAATTAIIVSATRSAMMSNREIVEVLHFVGANDRFIAREFEKHFLRLGIRAGLVGAGTAMAIFFLMPTMMELLGGGAVTMAEMRRLVGSGALDASGYVLLGIVVVIIAALCMLTSRFGVFRILNTRP